MNCPVDPNQILMVEHEDAFSNPKRYRTWVEELIYLTITRPDISFAISVVNQFMHNPCTDYQNAIICILRYLKKATR